VPYESQTGRFLAKRMPDASDYWFFLPAQHSDKN